MPEMAVPLTLISVSAGSSDFLRGQSVVLVGIEMLCYVIPECFVREILCINLYVSLCRFRSVNIHDGTPDHQ